MLLFIQYQCPSCRKVSGSYSEDRAIVLRCGDCLWNEMKIVEMQAIKVEKVAAKAVRS